MAVYTLWLCGQLLHQIQTNHSFGSYFLWWCTLTGGVLRHVTLHVGHLCESLPARGAAEWFLWCLSHVLHHVSLQISSLSESEAAHGAAEWFLT